MSRLLTAIAGVALSAPPAFGQAPPSKAAPAKSAPAAARAKEPLVEFEMMTWPEMKAALAAGKTTALVYAGGTEQRGPQSVNGGHTLMARATVKAIALKLGSAIAMPVLAYSPNRASADLPGTIGLSNEVFGQMLTEIAVHRDELQERRAYGRPRRRQPAVCVGEYTALAVLPQKLDPSERPTKSTIPRDDETDALVRPYCAENVVHQDYILTRARAR
jgi:hypothetical protein